LQLQACGVADGDALGVAFSGGLDSTVLLHLCRDLQGAHALQLLALHVDHGLHPDSALWSNHCQTIASELQIPFRTARLTDLDVQGRGLEAAARSERYRVLAGLNVGNSLLTGHHQQDQAETVLMRITRGSGVVGLAAMQSVSWIENILVVRPLLSFTRQQLCAYAGRHGLRWLEDPSNQDIHHDRNRIRHVILPQLRKLRPGVDQVLARVAGYMSQARDILEEVALTDLEAVSVKAHSHYAAAAVLDCQGLQAMSASRRTNLLQYWIRSAFGHSPSDRQQQAINRLATGAQPSGQVQLGLHSCRRYRQHLHLLLQLPALPLHSVKTVFSGPRQMLSPGIDISATPMSGGGLRIHGSDYGIGFRQGSECLRWHGHRRSLRGLFQRFSIPPWERGRIPLLYDKDTLVAVAGLWIADDWQATGSEQGLVLCWGQDLFGA